MTVINREQSQPGSKREISSGVQFGRTRVVAIVGDLLNQDAEAVVYPANCRGVMGAVPGSGFFGLRSLGGSVIEREAMSQAPLDLGTAIITSASGLEARGVLAVVHAVVHRALGDPPRGPDVRSAIGAAVAVADQNRLRSLAVPLIGIEGVTVRDRPERQIADIVDEMVTSLRRQTVRLERIVIACRYDTHALIADDRLNAARERLWTR